MKCVVCRQERMQFLPRAELGAQPEDPEGARPGESEQGGAVHAAATERRRTPACRKCGDIWRSEQQLSSDRLLLFITGPLSVCRRHT